jgi:hypothetical protein
MSVRRVVSRCCRTVVAGSLGLILPLSALAVDNVPPEALSVKVFPDRYVAAGRAFTDLGTLESWARPIRIRVLWLDNCNPASVQPVLAAVERFHLAYSEGIQIRTFGPGEPGCVLGNERATWPQDRMMAPPASSEYYSTDEFGRSKMP